MLEFSDSAGLYSQLTGVLAGFAFASLVALISVRLTAPTAAPNVSYAYSPLAGAFLALVATSLNYSIVASDHSNSARTATLEITAGLGFGGAGLILVYSVRVMLSAIEIDAPDPSGVAARAARLMEIVQVLGVCPLVVLLMNGAVQDHLIAVNASESDAHRTQILGLALIIGSLVSGTGLLAGKAMINGVGLPLDAMKSAFSAASIFFAFLSAATTSMVINCVSADMLKMSAIPSIGLLVIWILATLAQFVAILD